MTKQSANQLIMGFDFGQKKIGVAVGQQITGTASAIAIIKARDGIPNWDEIGLLIKQWQPTIVVVGLPLNMDGSQSELSRLALKFARRLEGRFNLPYEMMDERLTSFEARETGQDNPIDDVAAKLILESWLRQQAENNT